MAKEVLELEVKSDIGKTTKEADKLAGGKAIENAECLKCHATGAGSDPKLNDKKFTTDGVQCEACHGAGSKYKSAKLPWGLVSGLEIAKSFMFPDPAITEGIRNNNNSKKNLFFIPFCD